MAGVVFEFDDVVVGGGLFVPDEVFAERMGPQGMSLALSSSTHWAVVLEAKISSKVSIMSCASLSASGAS